MSYILVAEDDPLTRQMLKHSLELEGHVVVTVANGRLAIEKARLLKPRLLLLDLMMPGTSGADVVRTLRSNPEFDAVKILMITGVPDVRHIPEIAHADLILQKPVAVLELLRHVRELAEGQELQ